MPTQLNPPISLDKETVRQILQDELPIDCQETYSSEPLQTKLEILRRYQITLEFLDQGCIVRIGCKCLAFKTNQDALIAITQYINGDTVEIHNMYLENFK